MQSSQLNCADATEMANAVLERLGEMRDETYFNTLYEDATNLGTSLGEIEIEYK